MTNKFLLNLLGFNPDLTSRQPRVDTLSLVSRQSDLLTHLGRITAILVLVLTIGVGNAWGTHTVVKAGEMVSGEKYIITAEYNSTTYYLAPASFDYGGGTATAYTTSLTEAAAWTFTKSSSSWTITTKIGNTTYYLNNKNANNGVRSSANSQTWTVAATTSGASTVYITGGNSRKLALYNGENWRCYSSSSGVQTITLYKVSSCTDITPTLSYTSTNLTIGGGNSSSPTLNKDGSSGAVTWSSDDEDVATVNSSGVVTPVGTGTCNITASIAAAGGKCAGEVSVEFTVTRTITYYVGSTSYTVGGIDGETLVSTLPASPSSCDAVNYPHFYGWKNGSISGSTTTAPTILSTETVSSSSAANTYYAVFTDVVPSAGWEKLTSISASNIGDEVVFVYEGVAANYEMTGVASNLGTATSRDEIPDDITGTLTLTIEKGYDNTGYSFKNGTKYIRHNADKKIELSTTKDALSSWTVSGSSGNFKLNNNSNTSYNLQFNSGSPRWTDYSSSQSSFQIYKRASGGTVNYITTCCTKLGTINGSITLSQSGTSVTVKGWTYTQGSGAAESNINTYDVYLYSDADSYADPIQTQTCAYNAKATGVTFTSLSYGTTYKIKIGATGNTNYCDITPIQVTTINSTSTQTFQLACDVPTNVAASSITASSATVSWDNVATNYQYVLDQSSSDPAGAGTAVNGAHSVDLSTLSESTTYYFHVRTNCGNSVFSNWATISFNTPAAACSSYSFHDGTDGSNPSDWQINCFTYSGNSDRQWLKNFTIRNKSHYYVGYQGSFYNDHLGNKNAKSYTNQMQYMQLALDREHNSNNQLGSNYAGVQGTLLCYDNSSSDNLYIDFLPDGYYFILDAAGTPTALAMTCTDPDMTAANILSHNTVWETDIQTITYVNKKYTVGIKADATIAGKAWQTTRYNTNEDMTTLKKRNSSGGFTGTLAAADVTAGTRGKYRIWANNFSTTSGEKNWYAHFVPYFRITYDGSGADGSTTASTDVSCEGNDAARTVVAAANGFTVPTGKSFGGWASSPENAAAGTVAYAAGADVVLTQSIVLYAIWTDIDYTVTVNQNPSVSATTTGQTSSAHYNTTINLTTTVPSGYRFVNWTTSDGFSITNPTSATTASFTMPAKNVTVTANFQQTHTVDWYVGGSAPANKIGDDGQTTVVDHGGKIEDFPATTPDGSACDKTFVGWTNTSSYVHGTSPLFNDVAGSPTINADASFYAVFATGGSTEYVLTPAASLTAGEYVIAAYDDANSKYLALTGAVSAASLGSNSDMVNETTGFTISEGKFTTLPTGACEFVLTAYTGETDNGFYIQNPADDKYLDYQTTTNRRLWFYAATDYVDEYDNPTTPWAAWYGVALSKDGFPDNGMYLKYVDETYSLMSNGSGTTFVRGYANDNTKYKPIYLFKKTGGATGHTITCADCGTSVTPTYTAAPTGGAVSVTKSAAAVASGSTVKTCTSVDLTVTITPASHYTLTGFTATGLSTGTATISPVVAETLPKTTETTFTVTVSAGATGTLNLTPTFTEDAHVAINWNVNGVNQSIAATEGLTWVYSGGDLTALPSNPSVPAGCSGTKVFAGWSEKHSDATEEDASYYDDLFTAVGGAPTGISSAKTFYAVFATSSANPLAGTVIWDEPFTGFAADAVPTAKSSGATVYNSTVLTYACEDGGGTTKIYTADLAGGSSPELLVAKSGGSLTVSNIPTAGQTELTLSYKANYALEISSGTSGVTIGDASVEGSTYTRTITISQSPSAVNNFSLAFTKSTTGNARLDDIHLVVPGSGTMTDYVTLCAPSWTITYNKNTEDAVTNLPSPTSVLQSTGSGTLSSTVPERATYTFSGWAETTSGAVAYAAGGSITGVTGDKTLYAVWVKTPVEELLLNYSELNKYVGDPAVTLEVTGVTPEGADATVTWSSNNSSVASVVAATGVVTFGTVGTATITATSTVTGTTTAYCYVTVRNKPTASFVDLIHDGNGTDLSTYHMQNVAGTAIVFPTLDDYATPGDDCDTKHYVFVGWTTSDNNDDPQDHLVASGELEDDQDKVFYAVWADGVEGVSYTQLTTSTFKTSPTKYVIGAIDGDDTFYFYSCAVTDANNGNGGCTNAPGTNAPIQFTLSGTANALVATSTEATARYLTPLTAKNFQMSETSKTIQLNDDGTIANPSDDSWTLRFNTSEDYLRWYSSATGNAAYFYEVTAGAAVSYRTSCCTNNVPAPTVVATNTAYTVRLTWAAVDGATGYEVSWNGGAFEAATSPCIKSGLTASTDYIYKVRATYDPLVKCGALVASGSVTTDDVYSVTYSGGTGTGSCSPSGSVAPASYEAGATVTLAPTNSFSLTSNTFAAWVVKDADDNDVPVSNNQFTMPAKNVTVTATWTAVQDKYYDRMHDGTDALHGGFADGEGKYYLVLEGCNYTVPTLTDDDDGDTDCHTTHYKLLGWIAQSHLKTDGSGEIKTGAESYIFQGGGTKSATGATYYAIWAIMTE